MLTPMKNSNLLMMALLVASCACSAKNKASATEGGERPAIAKQTPPLSDPASRDGAPLPAFEITVWPEQWDVALEAASEAFGLPSEVWREYHPSPYEALNLVQQLVPMGKLPLSMPLVGIDNTRPYTISLTAPEVTFEAVAAAVITKQELPPARFPRLRFSLPAIDVDALANVFSDAAKSKNAKVIANMLATPEMALRVTKHETTITVDLVLGAQMPSDESGLKAALGPPPSAPAAAAFTIAAPSALRVIARSPKLAELGASMGMGMVLAALEEIDDVDMRRLVLAAGTSEVLSVFLVMDPSQDLSHVAMFDLSARGGGKAQLAFPLESTVSEAGKATTLRDGASLLLSDIEWVKVVQAIPNPSVLAAVPGGSAELMELFHECGWTCWVPFASGSQMVRALVSENKLDSSLAELKRLAGKRMPHARLAGDLLVVSQQDTVDPGRWQNVSYDAVPTGSSAASHCYREAALAVRASLKALSNTDPSQHGRLLASARSSLQGAQACAESEPASARRFAGLSTLVEGLSAQTGH